MDKITCILVFLFAVNSYALDTKSEQILDFCQKRQLLISNAVGLYQVRQDLSGPARTLYVKEKQENNISKRWDLLDLLPSETTIDFVFRGNELYEHQVYIPSVDRKEQPGEMERYFGGDAIIKKDVLGNKTSRKEPKSKQLFHIIDSRNPLVMGMLFYADDYNVNYAEQVTSEITEAPPLRYQIDYYDNMIDSVVEENGYIKVIARDRYFERANMYCIAWLDPSRGYLVKRMEIRDNAKSELKTSYETTQIEKITVGTQDIWIVKEAVIRDIYSDALVVGSALPLSEKTITLKEITINGAGVTMKEID